MFDAIVVGSGPAGVFTAYQLRPLKVLMLDVGYQASAQRLPPRNLYDLRQSDADVFNEVIGADFESLHNVDKQYMSPKLKGPLWRFLTQRPTVLPSDSGNASDFVMSFARGGLANAWGAGVLRYNDRDLEEFPFSASDLDPYYDELTRHIGINGCDDDLSGYFGSTKNLQTPLPPSPLSRSLLERYAQQRKKVRENGVTIGRTRAAILTNDHGRRMKYECFGQDFFQPNVSAIYHPGYTLDELIERREVEYISKRLVKTFIEQDGLIKVFVENIETGEKETYEAKKLFIAAGAINTARIVLASRNDRRTKLPILDNPVSFIPLINPSHIGDALPTHSFLGGELIAVYEEEGSRALPTQASFYGLGGPLRTDLLSEFPLPFGGNLIAGKYLLPALAMLQVFHADLPSADNYLQLKEDDSLNIVYKQKELGRIERKFIRAMRSLGFYSLIQLCKFPAPGSSIHYAGSLPMRQNPTEEYETDSFGKLSKSENVYISDAANFPRLPSKNHTFTIMANAMRIAEQAKRLK